MQTFKAKPRRSDHTHKYKVVDHLGNEYWYCSKNEAKLKVRTEKEYGFNTKIEELP